MISNLSVVFWVKPMVVYHHVFKKPVAQYFKTYFKYGLIGLVPLILTIYLTAPFKSSHTISAFSLNILINIIVINGVYLIIFWKTKEFDYFKRILIKIGSGLHRTLIK